nr:hypothetical protein [Candidatus Sigynarchaeota archaeon]
MDSNAERERSGVGNAKPRPPGVILIWVYLLSVAVVCLVVSLLYASSIGRSGGFFGTWGLDPILVYTVVYLTDQIRFSEYQSWALFFLLLGGFLLSSAYGLYEMKKPGRIMAVACALLHVAAGLYALTFALPHLHTPTLLLILYMPACLPTLGVLGGVSALVIGAAMLVYLLGDVRHHFE